MTEPVYVPGETAPEFFALGVAKRHFAACEPVPFNFPPLTDNQRAVVQIMMAECWLKGFYTAQHPEPNPIPQPQLNRFP